MQDSILDVQEKNAYIGQDFMTWLWFLCESRNGHIRDSQDQEFIMSLEQKITVQGGEGESRDINVSSGQLSELKEARMGLKSGKKVNQAKLKIEQDSEAWEMQLRAENFDFTGLKTPKVEMKVEEGEDPDSRFLEKMFLIEKVLGFVDDLFQQFLRKRFSDKWSEELAEMKKWIESEE